MHDIVDLYLQVPNAVVGNKKAFTRLIFRLPGNTVPLYNRYIRLEKTHPIGRRFRPIG